MQFLVTPEGANPKCWVVGCSPCRMPIQSSFGGPLSNWYGIVNQGRKALPLRGQKCRLQAREGHRMCCSLRRGQSISKQKVSPLPRVLRTTRFHGESRSAGDNAAVESFFALLQKRTEQAVLGNKTSARECNRGLV